MWGNPYGSQDVKSSRFPKTRYCTKDKPPRREFSQYFQELLQITSAIAGVIAANPEADP
jgi:hypothetical protein